MESLNFYRQQEPASDPKELASLYEELPSSLPELCAQIKQLLIHPSQLGQFSGQLPPGARKDSTTASWLSQHLKDLNSPIQSVHDSNFTIRPACDSRRKGKLGGPVTSPAQGHE